MKLATGLCAGLTALFAGVTITYAAGALAVGDCGAYGYSYNYSTMSEADDRALAECRGSGCRLVVRLEGACAAFAVDKDSNCGPWGWGGQAALGQARRIALQECRARDGRNCVIEAWVCDRNK